MRLRCPCCGASNSLDALVAHDGARDAIKAALELDVGLGGLVYQYLGLFRPAKNALGWDKVATLLESLNTMIASAQISQNGVAYVATRAIWQEAIRQTLANRPGLKLPLANHRYLMTVVAGIAGQQARQGEKERDLQRTGNTAIAAGAAARPEMTVLPVTPPRAVQTPEFVQLLGKLKRQKGTNHVQTTEPTASTGATDPNSDHAE
jgi:hypothetical protein